MKERLLQLLKNTWTVTLVGTMIGVYAGVYFNEYSHQKSQQQNIKRAILSLQAEMDNNESIITRHLDSIQAFYDPISIIIRELQDNDDLIMSSREMADFQNKYPGMLVLTDSSIVSDSLMKYSGDMDFNWPLLSVGLSDIAWTTFKETGLSSQLDFGCLYNFATLYKLQAEIQVLYNEWASMLFNKSDNIDGLLQKWRQLMEFEGVLIQQYKDFDEMNSSCVD